MIMIRLRTLSLLPLAIAITAPLALGACSKAKDQDQELAELDDNLTGTKDEPAVAGALQDQILVDPELTETGNGNAVAEIGQDPGAAMPADSGYDGAGDAGGMRLMSAPEPRRASAGDCTGCAAGGMTLGARAAAQTAGREACDAKLSYGMAWASRLPSTFPVYPKGRVQEAAGVSSGPCNVRVVSFTTSSSLKSVVDYYYTRARRSGYSAEYVLRDGEHVLGGTRDDDGGAYVVTLNRRAEGGTAVDIVANNGS